MPPYMTCPAQPNITIMNKMYTLTVRDIIAGRGKHTQAHPANIIYRWIIRLNQSIFCDAPSDGSKGRIGKWTLAKIRQVLRGFFLRKSIQCAADGTKQVAWSILDDQTCLKKVLHALREKEKSQTCLEKVLHALREEEKPRRSQPRISHETQLAQAKLELGYAEEDLQEHTLVYPHRHQQQQQYEQNDDHLALRRPNVHQDTHQAQVPERRVQTDEAPRQAAPAAQPDTAQAAVMTHPTQTNFPLFGLQVSHLDFDHEHGSISDELLNEWGDGLFSSDSFE